MIHQLFSFQEPSNKWRYGLVTVLVICYAAMQIRLKGPIEEM
jgi:hypothetical protein